MITNNKTVLSLFPGVGLLDRAFEECGFVVVRGPDLIFGGDVRRFTPEPGLFFGVIGGPPCQDFSSLRRAEPTGYGLEMLAEFCRVIKAAAPEWYLCENVSRVPDLSIAGYHGQRLDVDQRWFVPVSRLRHVQFGSKSGRLLHIERKPGKPADVEGCAVANNKRSFRDLCRLQGLPDDFELPGFTVEESKRAVGNGVPLPMGRALAQAVLEAYARPAVTLQRTLDGSAVVSGVCACECGRRVTGGQTYYDASCRKRAQRRRDRATAEARS